MSKRWSSEEKIKLMKLYSEGKTYTEIGKSLDRSANAIKLRLESIVYDNLAKGKSVEMLSKMLNTDAETIQQLYYSHKSFRESRGQQIENIDFNKQKNESPNMGIVNTIEINDRKKSRARKNLEKIETENKILEALIKNYKMKKDVRKLYIDGKLDKKSMEMYNKLVKQ